jgi:arylsulfatase A-like enzyme
VPSQYLTRFANITDPNRRILLAMIENLDEAIGNITQKLDQLGILNNTIIAFTSDNGGAIGNFGGSNFPLRGAKGNAFEGGHRVRSFIKASGLNSYTYEGLFHVADWTPTLLNAALGVNISEIIFCCLN